MTKVGDFEQLFYVIYITPDLSHLSEMSEFVSKKSLLRSLVCGESDISDNSDIEFVVKK